MSQHGAQFGVDGASRGFRARQEKASLKIDGAVALSFTVVAAKQSGIPADIDHSFSDEIKVISNYDGGIFDRW